jgi:DNA-binding NarL/FixJ family response regulator
LLERLVLTMNGLEFLIIDDDRIYALGLKTWLNALGFENSVRAADAVPYYDECSEPDVVLVDPQMAGIKSASMIREVKQRFPRCRLVVCSRSQWFEEGFAGNAMAEGADAFFCKGQPDEELLLTLVNLIECTPSLKDAAERASYLDTSTALAS